MECFGGLCEGMQQSTLALPGPQLGWDKGQKTLTAAYLPVVVAFRNQRWWLSWSPISRPQVEFSMYNSKTAAIFPLPMVAFERYLLADDHPEYPMTFALRLRFLGTIDRQAFEAAVEEAVARHPLLRALADQSMRRRPCWVSAGPIAAPVDWLDSAGPCCCPRGEAINLAREPGLRLWVHSVNDKVDVTAQFHHACCDGIGAMTFIGDLLACYAARRLPAGEQPKLPPTDIERLRLRGRFGRDSVSWFRRAGAVAAALRQAATFGRCRPTPLAAPPTSSPLPTKPEPFAGVRQRELDAETIERLRDVARRFEVTLNDLLLRDMFMTIASWNSRWSKGPLGKWLRVLMPQNLRDANDDRMPAANMVGMSFLSRRPKACLDAARLLREIRDETEFVKRSRRALRFIRVIELIQSLCGGMPRALTDDRCFTTVALSNMGDVTRWFPASLAQGSDRVVAGDLVLEAISGAPPVRAKTSATLLLFRYAGQLIINLNCDPRLFASEHADELLSDYVERLVQTSWASG
jgi:hypothetical protein